MKQPKNLGIVGNREHLERWLIRLKHGPLATDTEHTGFRWERDRIGGMSFAAGRTALYVYGNALGPAVHWLSDQAKNRRPIVFHNAKGDMHQLRSTFGLNIAYPVDDTMLMSFLLDNRGAFPHNARPRKGRHTLKNLAATFVDPAAKEPEDRLREAVVAAGGRRTKDDWKADMLMAPPLIVGNYAAFDAWYTLQLFEQFEPRLRNWVQPEGYPSLWSLYETERWLTLALRDMEARGILANPEFFDTWRIDLEKKQKKLYQKLEKMAGKEINWNSPPQLRALLFEDLGLQPTRWTGGGKKSDPQPSTDEVSLLNLDHPIGAVLLQLRDVNKQLTTYARGLLEAIWDDGRIHCNFKQTGARTGRLSAEEPNLQQVPRESGARRGFIPDPGLVLRFADYSQVEMRFAAHISDDPTLVEGFRHDPDFDTHAATAMKMWGMKSIDPEGNKSHKRRRKFAKIMNFAMLFGAGEDKVTSQLISMLSVEEASHACRELKHRIGPGESPHRSLAQLLRKRYFEEFSSVKGARYSAEKRVKQMGYAMNELGRHRYLDHDETYKAFNTAIQGSAADLAKKGLASLYRELQMSEGSIALLLQIHDEAVYLSDGDPKTDRRVLEILNDTTSYRVPIVADVEGSDTSWQDKKELHL